MNHSATTTPFSKRSWRLRPGERRGTLIFGDFLVALLALVGGLYFWSQGNEWLNFSWQFLQERVPVWFYFMPLIWMLLLIESYDTRRSSARLETVKEISLAAGVSLAIYLIVFFIFNSDSGELPRRGVISFIGFAYILTLVWRFVYIGLFNTPQFMRRVIIVGAGKSGSQLVKIIHGIWPPPFFTIGLVDDDPDKLGTEIEGLKILGSSANLFELVQQHQATDLIFSIMGDMDSEVFEKVLEAEERGIEVTTMPIVYEELLGRVPIFLLKSDWVLRSFVDQAHVGGFYDLAKRLIDIIGGLFGTFILGISFPFIGTAILLESGFPIFYYQERLGKNGRLYKMIKYRSMVQDAEADGIARASAADDHRATFVGRFLRKSHLDELPQFINILRGDMSIVGPRAERPELIEQLQQHIPFYRARLFVKPGLSGWAQINFGYANDYESNGIKLEYDLYYIKHRNLLLDFNIMIRTVGTVIGLRGH
jgi:exopolysaccharide biosynthesis polyprenyl glycosylphosphotransferase